MVVNAYWSILNRWVIISNIQVEKMKWLRHGDFSSLLKYNMSQC